MICVRAAEARDVPAMALAHLRSSHAAYAEIAPPEDEREGLARRERTWSENIASPDYDVFVAEEDYAIVGVLCVGASEDDPSVGELYSIYVAPEAWGGGAGQLLLERAHQALAHRHDEALLRVLPQNERARRFYERNGWTLAETRVEPHFGGRPTDVAIYRRRL